MRIHCIVTNEQTGGYADYWYDTWYECLAGIDPRCATTWYVAMVGGAPTLTISWE